MTIIGTAACSFNVLALRSGTPDADAAFAFIATLKTLAKARIVAPPISTTCDVLPYAPFFRTPRDAIFRAQRASGDVQLQHQRVPCRAQDPARQRPLCDCRK